MRIDEIRIVEINTTAFEGENFFIITDLTDDEIQAIIEPIIESERNNDEWYDNDMLIKALYDAYPNRLVKNGGIEYLSI